MVALTMRFLHRPALRFYTASVGSGQLGISNPQATRAREA